MRNYHIVGSCSSRDLSRWGVVLVGSCPSLSWGNCPVGNCPGAEKS